MEFNKSEHTRITLSWLRKQTDSVILFYSGGKDSLVLLDLLSRYNFKTIVCCFMYLVKDLEHQKPHLNWIKKYKNTELLQYPHWSLSLDRQGAYYMHTNKKTRSTPTVKLTDIYKKAKKDTGINWIVNGAKRADSFNRRIWLGSLKFNAISTKSQVVYPLSYWKKADVVQYIKMHGIMRPITYPGRNKRSVGLDITTEILVWLRDNYPGDLEKVLKEYPLAGVLLKEYDHGKVETSKV